MVCGWPTNPSGRKNRIEERRHQPLLTPNFRFVLFAWSSIQPIRQSGACLPKPNLTADKHLSDAKSELGRGHGLRVRGHHSMLSGCLKAAVWSPVFRRHGRGNTLKRGHRTVRDVRPRAMNRIFKNALIQECRCRRGRDAKLVKRNGSGGLRWPTAKRPVEFSRRTGDRNRCWIRVLVWSFIRKLLPSMVTVSA